MGPRRTYQCILLFLVSSWCLGFLAAPLLRPVPGAGHGVAEGLYAMYGTVCHQMEERSLVLGEHTLAVCARCSALYGAFWLGTIVLLLAARSRRVGTPHPLVLALAVAPLALDALMNFVGIHESTVFTRVATGTLTGIVLPLFVVPSFVDALLLLRHKRSGKNPAPGSGGRT